MLFVMWVSENTCCLTSRLWKKAKVTIDSEYTHQFLFSFFFFSCCAWKWKIRWYNPAPETWQGVCFAVLTGVVLLIKTGFCWWLMSLEHVLETCGVIIFFFFFFLRNTVHKSIPSSNSYRHDEINYSLKLFTSSTFSGELELLLSVISRNLT